MKRLLLVDDDEAISPLTKEYLTAKGFDVTLRNNAMDGLNAFTTHDFDLCVLDIKMPGKDGFWLAQEILNLSPTTPFLFLSAESDQAKRIDGLKLGASDYILKPFSLEELYLRIKLILSNAKRHIGQNDPEKSTYKIGQYLFDINARELSMNNEQTALSTIETHLLQLFCRAENGFVSREFALKTVWNDAHLLHSRSLNVYVSKLRKHLSKDPAIDFQNVHGSGYKMAIKNLRE